MSRHTCRLIPRSYRWVLLLATVTTLVGGYLTTGWDLVANLAGTTIAATLIVLTGRGSGPATE